MRRKLLSVALCVCMMFTMVPFAFATEADSSGSGAEGGSSGSSTITPTETGPSGGSSSGGSEASGGTSSGGSSSSGGTEAATSDGAALMKLFTDVKAGESGSGDVTVTIDKNYDLTGYTWTPIPVQGYTGAGVVTVKGNGHTITGLNAPLFAGGFAGTSGIVIEKLTLTNVNIDDSTNSQGIGAFINNVDSMPKIELDDCHLTDSTIVSSGGARVGGLIGWTSGYNKPNDGPVNTYITVNNCSVENVKITANGSVGGIIGHAGANPATFHTFTNNTVTGCTLSSTDDGDWRVGVVAGTVNVGEVSITGITESGNTLSQTGKTAPAGQTNLYGRFIPNETGKLEIDGTPVFDPAVVATIDGKGYKSIAAAVNAGDGKTVTLLKDVTEDVVIPSGKTVTLDLNGKKLTNASSNTITNNGTLIITGEGTVDNVTHAKAAVWNNVGGTVTINDGTYTRSAEKSTDENNSGGNSYYVIDNYGTLTINKGTFKFSDTNAGAFSSLIHNGWYDGKQNTSGKNAVMTINDGNFTQGTGGKITVKNDDYGELNLKGGVFTQPQSNYYCVYNYNIARISGGTINGYVGNEYADATSDKGYMEISDGAVINGNIQSRTGANQNASDTLNLIKIMGNAKVTGTITSGDTKYVIVSGGYFTTDPSDYLSTNPKAYTVASDKTGYSYMVTTTEPTKAPVIVKDATDTALDPSIKDENTKAEIQNIINKANIDGTAEAISENGKAAILKDAGVTDADQSDKNTKITIDVKVTVTATQANLSGNDSASKSITFTATPVATVTVGTTQKKTDINVDNSYLDGKEITVTLPLPANFVPAQIKHTSADGSVEYFLREPKRGAQVFTYDEVNHCAILKITKFSTFEVSGTQTYVEPSSGSGSSGSTSYAVNVNAATNGAVAADKKTASKGTTVTVTATPSTGYVVDAVKVVDKDGKDVAVTVKNGKYVFTMPGSAVTVTATFKAETPAPSGLPFTDVKSGDWFYNAVKYAYEQGLMTGTSATTFAPNGTMNRAMIVTVLYRLEKSPAVTGASKFADVPAGQWYSDAVAWAAANNIVNGYNETTFGPMNPVTREQMAAILFRYEQYKGLENVTLEENLNRFPDKDKISAYAVPALQWAVGQKIINGNADGTLNPTGTATRAQVAQIFTNLLNK